MFLNEPIPLQPDVIDEFFHNQPIFRLGEEKDPQIISSLPLTEEKFVFNNSVTFEAPENIWDGAKPVWVKGNVHVKGTLRNAVIVALGSVTFEDEVTNSIIYAFENIRVWTARQATFVSFGTIQIAVETERCTMMAVEDVVGAAESTVRAGKITSAANINLDGAMTLTDDSRVHLLTGERKLQVRKIQILEAQVVAMEADSEKLKKQVQDVVKTLIQRKMMNKRIPELDALKKRSAEMEHAVKGERSTFEVLKENALKVRAAGRIIIRTSISDNAKIEMNDKVFETKRSYRSVRFEPVAGDILPSTIDYEDLQKLNAEVFVVERKPLLVK